MVGLLALFVLLLSASALAVPDIIRVGPYGGDVRSLAVHPAEPDRFFLGTADGQIYVSNDGGETWNRQLPGLERRNLVVDNLAFDPQNPDVLYAATWELNGSKGWLFRTHDGGKFWENVSLGAHHSTVRAIAIAPANPDVIALGISEGVILSRDRGKTWDRITRGYRSLYNVESLAFDPRDPDTLYVGTWHLGWKTTNGGKTWEPVHQGMVDDSDMFSVLVHPRDPNVLFASACTGVYKSESAGSIWKKLKNGPTGEARRTRTLHFDPSDPETVYAGTTLGLFVSKDGGASWRHILRDVVINAVAVCPRESQMILVGTDDAGILKSTDGGVTFREANQGFIHRQIGALAADPGQAGRYYASVLFDRHYGGFFISENPGAGWDIHNDGLGGAVAYIHAILPSSLSRKVYLGTASGLFQAVVPEEKWQRIEPTQRLSIFDIVFSDASENGIFLATSSGVFHLDLKRHRLDKLAIPVYKGQVNALFYDRDSNALFAGTEIGVFRSVDGGKTWKVKVKGLPPTAVNVLEKSGERLFCGTRQGLFWSDDGGESWSRCNGIYSIDVAAVKSNPLSGRQLFAGDFLVGYLFRSDDGGSSWTVIEKEKSRIANLIFDRSGNILAGTASDGIYLIKTTEAESSGQ